MGELVKHIEAFANKKINSGLINKWFKLNFKNNNWKENY